MLLALPRQKTLAEQAAPALIAIALIVAGSVLIPVRYPVQVSNGSIVPEIVRAGDTAAVEWMQDWRELCPVTVTREFVGSDGFKRTSAPYLLSPPKVTGASAYRGLVIIPDLPVGDADYSSQIQPHCPIDSVWQRSYKTPAIKIIMLPKLPNAPH